MPFAIAVLTLLFSQRGIVTLPDVFYVDPTSCEPVRVTASYQRAANVPAQVERICRPKHAEVWCRAPYVSEKLVSIECAETWDSVHPEYEPWAINLENGESLKEISRHDLFADEGAEAFLGSRVRQALKENAPDASEEQIDEIDNLARRYLPRGRA